MGASHSPGCLPGPRLAARRLPAGVPAGPTRSWGPAELAGTPGRGGAESSESSPPRVLAAEPRPHDGGHSRLLIARFLPPPSCLCGPFETLHPLILPKAGSGGRGGHPAWGRPRLSGHLQRGLWCPGHPHTSRLSPLCVLSALFPLNRWREPKTYGFFSAKSPGRPRMLGLIPVTGVKQGVVQSCRGPRPVAPGVAGGPGFWSWPHMDVGRSPAFTAAPQARCGNTRLLRGVGRMTGPQAGVREGLGLGADEGKRLQGQETPPGPRPRERLGPPGPP